MGLINDHTSILGLLNGTVHKSCYNFLFFNLVLYQAEPQSSFKIFLYGNMCYCHILFYYRCIKKVVNFTHYQFCNSF